LRSLTPKQCLGGYAGARGRRGVSAGATRARRGSADTPVRGHHGGQWRSISGLVRSLPVWAGR
jgi:hypothetical protein